MNICIDVGNTTIAFGFYYDKNLLNSFIFNTNSYHTKYEFVTVIKPLLQECGIDPSKAEKIMYSSVVPAVDAALKDALKIIFGKEVISIRPGIKTGLIIKVDNPNEVGGDIIADLVGAKEKYGYPVIIADLGTASKVLYIDENGAFSTCLIFPGLEISKSVLSNKAALLPEIGFKEPKPILKCHNTVDAMNSGVIYSHISGVRGVVEQYQQEIGKKVKVVLTGGVATYLQDFFKDYVYDPSLTLDGLNYILHKQK